MAGTGQGRERNPGSPWEEPKGRGRLLQAPTSRTRRSAVPPEPAASVSPLSDQTVLHRPLYLTSCCGNYGSDIV